MTVIPAALSIWTQAPALFLAIVAPPPVISMAPAVISM
jgi:hypothetical protein